MGQGILDLARANGISNALILNQPTKPKPEFEGDQIVQGESTRSRTIPTTCSQQA